MIEQLHRDLWSVRRPQRFLGAEIGTRMTVIRLKGGGLWIHSPIPFEQSIRCELDAYGPVRFIIAPNRFHHLYVGPCAGAFPEAKVFGAPDLERKRRDLRFDAILDDAPPAEWAGQIDQLIFRAFPPLNEVIFFHRATRTLVLTDLLFNVRSSDSVWTRFLMTLDGGLGRAAVARSFKLLIKMRREQAQAAVERILSWDFDRILLAHGEAVEKDARQVFSDAWSFL